MLHQIVGASILAPFRPGHDYRPALDEAAALGFNLVRTFCGPLPWCGQERVHVYDKLPVFMAECADRGMNAYLSYVTEAGTGYDIDAHVQEVEAMARNENDLVLREVANEPWHPSQGGRLAPAMCGHLRAWMHGPACYGASTTDEATDYDGGDFAGPHLDRSRDRWNMVRRVRELHEKHIAINQEPIGADEVEQAGKRLSDPAVFLCMGALNRLFLGGNGVFHSQAGLMAQPLGPVQRQCAQAFVTGTRLWPGAHRLTYQNSNVNGGWHDSPVQWHPVDDIVRAYSGVDGQQALVVLVGAKPGAEGSVRLGEGWRIAAVLASSMGLDGRGCIVWHLTR